MTGPLPVRPAPGPLEEYATRFDDPFFVVLAPSARVLGATRRGYCSPPSATRPLPPWWPTPNRWPGRSARKPRACNGSSPRVRVGPEGGGQRAPPRTLGRGPGDRPGRGGRAGHRRARGPQVGQAHRPRGQAQWLGNLGKTDNNGVVSVSSLWAATRGCTLPPGGRALHAQAPLREGQVRSPLAHQAEKIAQELLVERSVEMGVPFRAVVADSFYGEDEDFKRALSGLGVGYACWP